MQHCFIKVIEKVAGKQLLAVGMTGFSDTVFSTGGSLNKRQVDSQSSDNDFIYPPPSGDNGPNNTILQIGSTVDLKWATTLPFTDLMLFQQLERVPDCGGCVNGPYMIAGWSHLSISIGSFPDTFARQSQCKGLRVDSHNRKS